MKIGVFGGSFNPPHNGHLNVLQTVLKKCGLDKILVIPTWQSPLKQEIEGPTPQQRLKMTELAVEHLGENYIVDPQEVLREGISYTYNTIQNLKEKYKDIYIIIGADQFEQLDQWHRYLELLTDCNFIITTRPGFNLPESEKELPNYLQKLVLEFDFNFLELKTGKSLQFITLNDVEISSTRLRKKLRLGRPAGDFLPLPVELYIQNEQLYRQQSKKIKDYKDFSLFCANALDEKKGIMIKVFDLSSLENATSDFTLVTSGTSTRHAISLAENLIISVKENFNLNPLSVEGLQEGRWVVVDYGSLIVHVFYDFIRQEYSLEKLWSKAVEIPYKESNV